MTRLRLTLCIALLIGLVLSLSPQGAVAQDVTSPAVTLPELTGPVLLTVAGLDEKQFEGGEVRLDIGRMKALGATVIETGSIWTQGRHRYTGVLMADLVRALGLDRPGAVVELQALNDYRVDFPLDEATDRAPILAYLVDGRPMPVRDKGPVWMVYPYDSGVEYRTDTIYARSVWQLDRIEVLR